MRQINKAGTQLMARCFFCQSTGKVELDNYSKYYDNIKKKKLFN